ncbi:MAG: excinuclease ABC subunit UvrA [Deltaproteobacteria bacterium]|nr:excinuclease ABC subunit UvrA [Deltaproteobacteria bacterium]
MSKDQIVVRGAREHNLKNLDLDIPRDQLTVVTGLSGSGKSSLAFDTLYAEGQRRYVESLSSYARQFLEKMDKPDVDLIEGLSPAISIEQKSTSHNPRSTVGTVTEIHDFFRVLFARVGEAHCHKCGRPIKAQTPVEIVDRILTLPEGTKIIILAPLVSARKGEHQKLFERLRKDGFSRVRLGKEIVELSDELNLDKRKKHDIAVVVDRLVIKEGLGRRLTDSVELALRTAEGLMVAAVPDDQGKINEEYFFSERFACDYCGLSFPDLTPQLFSFNSPAGACPVCGGLGRDFIPDLTEIVPDPDLSISEGALAPCKGYFGAQYFGSLEVVAKHLGVSVKTPWKDLPESARKFFLEGSGGELLSYPLWNPRSNRWSGERKLPYEGVLPGIKKLYQDPEYTEDMGRYMNYLDCPACQGTRLRPEALAVKVAGRNLAELASLPAQDSLKFFQELDLGPQKMAIGQRIIREITERLGFLCEVGLGYLTLSRGATTLSGGESQRIRLATQIGSHLVGVTYILDEPSIGLHQRDNQKLLAALKRMRDQGNTIIVVEHDAETIESADYVVDLGPGAGELGGKLIVAGTPGEVAKSPDSLTGQYLSGRQWIEVPRKRREARGYVTLRGAKANNLKDLTVKFPLGVFICVTGVSGSGKSSLIMESLHRALSLRWVYPSHLESFMRAYSKLFESVEGLEFIDKVIDIDQSPIGRTPRSNPATYIGVLKLIRDLFAQLPESRARGYPPGRYSFNVRGGRCETCQGDGIIKIEMHFLPDVFVKCEACHGRRFNRDTLEIKYNGANIADVLEMTVDTALEFFQRIPLIKDKLATLSEVGLGYIRLGQSSTTLSGGEAQRIKLSKELSRRSTGKTFYILDEPTTGLHFEDVKKLLEVLQKLVAQGNTVLVIEHNLDVIKCADHLIDLGPEGGDSGGFLLAEGTPEAVAKNPDSQTGFYLKKMLRVR